MKISDNKKSIKGSVLILLIQLFFFLPIESQNIEDINLLKIFLRDNQKDFKQDSLYITPNNSNIYIIQNFEEYLELEKDSFIKMPNQIVQKVNNEYKFVTIKKGDSNYERLINKPWVSIKPDSLLKKVYKEKHYQYFQKQIVDGKWDIDFSEFDGIFEAKENFPAQNVFSISKPIYTIDGKFALIYIFPKINSGIFIYISIYRKDETNSWNRVYVIPPNFINQ